MLYHPQPRAGGPLFPWKCESQATPCPLRLLKKPAQFLKMLAFIRKPSSFS